jgi:hypothetical protein
LAIKTNPSAWLRFKVDREPHWAPQGGGLDPHEGPDPVAMTVLPY